jgi:hypothetical protein
MALPTSTISLEQAYIINQIDPSVSSITISSAGTATVAFAYAGASKLEIPLIIAGSTGANLGTLQFTWNVYEPFTGSIYATYTSQNITAGTNTYIGIYDSSAVIGSNGYLTWSVGTVANATWTPCYARIYAKF